MVKRTQLNVKGVSIRTYKLFVKHTKKRSMKMSPLIVTWIHDFINKCEKEENKKRIVRGDKEY